MDVVLKVREDEAGHRDVNHSYANILNNKSDPNEEQQATLNKTNS